MTPLRWLPLLALAACSSTTVVYVPYEPDAAPAADTSTPDTAPAPTPDAGAPPDTWTPPIDSAPCVPRDHATACALAFGPGCGHVPDGCGGTVACLVCAATRVCMHWTSSTYAAGECGCNDAVYACDTLSAPGVGHLYYCGASFIPMDPDCRPMDPAKTVNGADWCCRPGW